MRFPPPRFSPRKVQAIATRKATPKRRPPSARLRTPLRPLPATLRNPDRPQNRRRPAVRAHQRPRAGFSRDSPRACLARSDRLLPIPRLHPTSHRFAFISLTHLASNV